MYEVDTERMLIKNALLLYKFSNLNNQYLSFVQVGGAYAHMYRPIIEFLEIKSVLITDIDYDKKASTIDEIKEVQTTNSTINEFSKLCLNKEKPTIQDLYDWCELKNTMYKDLIFLAFQGEKDGYSRTLEEAMLSKLYKVIVIDSKGKSEWKKLRNKYKLKYTVPKGEDHCNIRDIVNHTASNKTDFMYSVILNNLVEEMLPKYIEETLLWLDK